MGTLPVAMVAGSYYAIYEAYYLQVDPGKEGRVNATVAAKFLKTSGLPDDVLSKVWDLADENSKGYLTKSEFFVALKLVALIQAGKEAISANLMLDIPPPQLVDSTASHAACAAASIDTSSSSEYRTAVVSDWAMKPEEKSKYDKLFDSLDSSNGLISGNDVKGLLMDSKLPVDALGKIWDLADMDKDGALDRHEFSVAMHLVYKALEKYAIPSHLPPELLPPAMKKEDTRLPRTAPAVPALANGVRVTTAPVVTTTTTTTIKASLPPSALSMIGVAATPPIAPFVQPASNLVAVHSTVSAGHSAVVTPVNASSATPLSSINTSSPPFVPSVSSPPASSTTVFPPLLCSSSSSHCSTSAPVITTATSPLLYSVNTPSGACMTTMVTSTTPAKPPIGSLPSTTQSPLADFTAVTFSTNNLFPSNEESWIISAEEKTKFDNLFEQADLDKDGFVSGHEIKDTFLKSGVSQSVLAHIWNLCDTEELGKLNREQFALALWLIKRKLKGIDPPMKLTNEMVPPSCRKLIPNDSLSSSNDVVVFNSPEVDRLTAEIDDLAKEKLLLETNITQREADIRIKSSEHRSLQNELDALAATLKQLENQKGEALKRINDLKTQVSKLRQQAEEQETQLKCQEAELSKRKEELKNIKSEETSLKGEREILKKQIDDMNKSSVESVEVIDEIRAKMTELEDFQTQLNTAISNLDSVLQSKNVTSLSEIFFNVEPKFRNESFSFLCERASKVVNFSSDNAAAADPFSSTIRAQTSVENENFASTDSAKIDPFTQHDPFGGTRGEFGADRKMNMLNFGDLDAFAPFDRAVNVVQKTDPFADNATSKAEMSLTQQRHSGITSSAGDAVVAADPFGCDPFAILHAPARSSGAVVADTHLTSPSHSAAMASEPSRSESPSPALPPKKCKQPPPRPAPPRPAPPAIPSGFDAANDFADFSNFSRKVVDGAAAAVTTASNSANVVHNRGALLFQSSSIKVDPFRNYHYDDPFEMADRYDKVDDMNQKNVGAARALRNDSTSKIPRGASAPPLMDAFEASFLKIDSSVGGGDHSSPVPSKPISGLTTKSVSSSEIGLPSEDQQLAWATADSVKAEKERRKRAEQEKADYKLAMKLSKAEGRKKSFRSKIMMQ